MRNPLPVALLASLLALGPTRAAEPNEQTVADVTVTTCNDLARLTEDDRACALIFYYGYLAGRSDARTIDQSRVSEQLLGVRDYCTAHPKSKVLDAFAAALE